tara:strand:+ start:148 stop:312 length:165 start_codon:yes stop_codon:yes gene_type:complete
LRKKTKTAVFTKVCGIETQTNIAADFELVCGEKTSDFSKFADLKTDRQKLEMNN